MAYPPRPFSLPFTSAGLTTAVTAYTSGDQLGTEINLSFATPHTQLVVVTGIYMLDISNVIGATDFYFFNGASTPAADNAAASWSDANILKLIAVINATQVNTSGANKTVTWTGRMPFQLNSGESLLLNLVTRTGNAVFGDGATSLSGRIFMEMV